MNVLSDDIIKPPTEIAPRNDKSTLSGGENTSQSSSEETHAEFATALANLAKPDALPQDDIILATQTAVIGFQPEQGSLIEDADMNLLDVTSEIQLGDNPLSLKVEIKLDDKASPAVQLLPSQDNLGNIKPVQEVLAGNVGKVETAPNIDLPAINSGLVKNLPPVLGTAPIITSDASQTKKGNNVFVDIEGVPEKILPNSANIESVPAKILSDGQNIDATLGKTLSNGTSTVTSTVSLSQQINLGKVADSSGSPAQLPTLDLGEMKPSHSQMTARDFLSASVGEANLQLQASAPVQVSGQITNQATGQILGQVPGQAQSVVVQVREPILATLGAAQAALQNKNGDKPKDIVVQLSPAELGRVQIRFSFDAGDRVVAQIAAENADTMAVLRQKSGLLSVQLKQSGFDNIDVTFDTSSQKGFSEQNSNTDFFKQHDGQTEANVWQATKVEPEGDTEQLNVDDNVYPLRARMGLQSAQIDIIL